VNSFRSLGGERGSRIGFLVALGLAVGLIGLSVMAGSASAGSVTCGGTVAADSEHHAENSLKYTVKCNEEVQGYSIVSNRSIAYFGTEVVVFAGTEVAEGEAFTCEGIIPGSGIGCYGKMSAGNTVEGNIGTADELCEAQVQPKFWVVALTTQIAKEKPFPLTSEPFQLGIKCDTLNAKQKAKDKATKVCAKVKQAESKKARTAARKRCKQAQTASKKAQKA
jgi:hypothetical protein